MLHTYCFLFIRAECRIGSSGGGLVIVKSTLEEGVVHYITCSIPSLDVCMDYVGDIDDKSVKKCFELSIGHGT